MNSFSYLSPIGYITIREESGYITNICFGKENNNTTNDIIKCAVNQLNEYFEGKRKTFNLPLKMKGTEFQKRVWNVLLTIPYGETKSYGEIAELTGNRKACRAVGMANNKNPIAIVVPCHRVIGKNGSLTGYAGGLSIKEKLLSLEENFLDNKRFI